MTVGEKIREARLALDMSQDELARKLGYKGRSSINKIEKDASGVPIWKLKEFASALNVDPASLFDIPEFIQAPNVATINENVYTVPVYEFCSAGLGAIAYDTPIENMPVMLDSASQAERCIALKVRGDSMLPKIEDGDSILVEHVDFVPDGKIGVFLIGGENAVVKKVQYRESAVILVSLNPNYEPMVFSTLQWARDVRTQGIVRKVMRDL